MGLNNKIVEKFLNSYQSKNTKSNYLFGIKMFFTQVYGNSENLEEKASNYFSEKRDSQEDVQNYINTINGQSPKTIRLRLATVKSFLLENNVELPQQFWRKVSRKIKGTRALTIDRVPTTKDLREIFSHLPVHGVALFQVLASSGMRIGEALKLQVSDMHLDQKPALIEIRGDYTKTGNSRYTFVSREAVLSLKQWLNVRSKWLKSASRKSHLYGKKENDPRVFPFTICVVYRFWQNALAKSKKDERDNNTNRYKLHPHVLRKFFRTKLATLIPVDIVEALMGHEGYLTEVYRRYTQEDLAKHYLKGESALLVYTEAEDLTQIRKEIEERNVKLQTITNGLFADNMDLKNDNLDLKNQNLDLKKRVSLLEDSNIQVAKRLESLEKLLRKTVENL